MSSEIRTQLKSINKDIDGMEAIYQKQQEKVDKKKANVISLNSNINLQFREKL